MANEVEGTIGKNCPLVTGLRPCECDLPRCPECGYTKHDAQFEMDHHVCSGEIPGTKCTCPERAQPSEWKNVPMWSPGDPRLKLPINSSTRHLVTCPVYIEYFGMQV